MKVERDPPAEVIAALDAYREAVASRAEAGFGIGSGITAAAEREARAELLKVIGDFGEAKAAEVPHEPGRLAAILIAAAEGLEGFQGKWLIYTTAGHAASGEVYLWWKPGAAGYTVRVEDAGRYTDAELRGQGFKRAGPGLFVRPRDVGTTDADYAVPAEDVLRHAKRVVPMGALARQGSLCPW